MPATTLEMRLGDGIPFSDGDLAFVSAGKDLEKNRVLVRVRGADHARDIVVVSEDVWTRLLDAQADTGSQAVAIRALSRVERVRRRITHRHASVIVTILSAILVALLAAWPLLAGTPDASIRDARMELAITKEWKAGTRLQDPDVSTLTRARSDLDQAAAVSSAHPGLRWAAVGAALGAALLAGVSTWRTADEQV